MSECLVASFFSLLQRLGLEVLIPFARQRRGNCKNAEMLLSQ